ncbi:DUF1573 domain-containing protein [Termitidicoccus mucosus]|uniref:DUF1573 domain-containing protein n=1 Tax=Termitidicoccus mucosus TaxID=1184151 RepID=A0A178IPP8_9BACT|nr:hypothetical protein AW736_01855 [Opitutaceae bacterium TSB47]
MKNTILLVLALIAANAAHAGLEWKHKELSIEVSSRQSEVEVSFPFKVTGTVPVGIISMDTSCSCMTPSHIVGEHKPGAEGVLKVRYAVGNNKGTSMEKITVHSTDPDAPKTELRLIVYATLTYRIEPKYAFWTPGAPAEAKDLYFLDVATKGLKPLTVYSTSTNFSASIIPQDTAHRYVIRIQPVSTEKPEGAHIYVDVDMGGGQVEKTKILVAVKDPNEKTVKVR